jgi:hypothetical protein
MPAVGQGTKPVKVKVRPAAKAKKPSQAPVQSPDSRDNNQAARAPKPPARPSPDATDVTDRSRRVPVAGGTVPQRAIDQQYAAGSTRVKARSRRANTRSACKNPPPSKP